MAHCFHDLSCVSKFISPVVEVFGLACYLVVIYGSNFHSPKY